jgi:hypothetical protein
MFRLDSSSSGQFDKYKNLKLYEYKRVTTFVTIEISLHKMTHKILSIAVIKWWRIKSTYVVKLTDKLFY